MKLVVFDDPVVGPPLSPFAFEISDRRDACSVVAATEIAAGNREFSKAEKALRASVEALPLPEVRYFIETFVPSLTLTLDELG